MISIQQLGGHLKNTEMSRRWPIQHAVGPDSVFFFIIRMEWGWEHNYFLDGLNQWITQLRNNWHQMRAGSNGKRKRGSENSFWIGDTSHFFPRRLEGYGKKHLHKLWKYVQSCQRSQRVEDARRQLYQAVAEEVSESNMKWNQSSIQGWLNLMPHCPPPPLELWVNPLY